MTKHQLKKLKMLTNMLEKLHQDYDYQVRKFYQYRQYEDGSIMIVIDIVAAYQTYPDIYCILTIGRNGGIYFMHKNGNRTVFLDFFKYKNNCLL